MLGIGGQEIMLILVLALIILGPKKMPDIARTMGKAMGEFQRASQDLKREMNLSASEPQPAKPKPQKKKTPPAETPEQESAPSSETEDVSVQEAAPSREQEQDTPAGDTQELPTHPVDEIED